MSPPTLPTPFFPEPLTLSQLVPAVRRLPAQDKLRLIRILAEELETADEIFPFKEGVMYALPTPYDSFGAAEILAEAMAAYREEGSET
jgi:hypothetical protein